MRRLLGSFLPILLVLSLDLTGIAQQDQVESTENPTVFKSNVVTRTTKAVDYRHRGGSTKVDLRGTEAHAASCGRGQRAEQDGTFANRCHFERHGISK